SRTWELALNPTRRTLLRTAGLALASPSLNVLGTAAPGSGVANAQERTWWHGLSTFEELKYPPGFKHFEYVNPNAPKGGTVRQLTVGTFDNFNPVVSSVKGNIAAGVGSVFDMLMTEASDEATSEYGLLADAVSHPPDFSWT